MKRFSDHSATSSQSSHGNLEGQCVFGHAYSFTVQGETLWLNVVVFNRDVLTIHTKNSCSGASNEIAQVMFARHVFITHLSLSSTHVFTLFHRCLLYLFTAFQPSYKAFFFVSPPLCIAYASPTSHAHFVCTSLARKNKIKSSFDLLIVFPPLQSFLC